MFGINVKVTPIMNKSRGSYQKEYRNWHHSRAMEINLTIIIDDTLFRNIKALEKLFFINGDITLKAQIYMQTGGSGAL